MKPPMMNKKRLRVLEASQVRVRLMLSSKTLELSQILQKIEMKTVIKPQADLLTYVRYAAAH